MGQPMAGVELKLAPVEGKLEARRARPDGDAGLLARRGIDAQAFDEEGFYRFGDGVRFATPGDAAGGFLLTARIARRFQAREPAPGSASGRCAPRWSRRWPRSPRTRSIAGHDRDDVAGLDLLDIEACRPLAESGDLADPKVREAFRKRLATPLRPRRRLREPVETHPAARRAAVA